MNIKAKNTPEKPIKSNTQSLVFCSKHIFFGKGQKAKRYCRKKQVFS